jgi:hypothetical protein
MKVYLGKDRQHTAQHMTATHATVTELIRNIGHGLANKKLLNTKDLNAASKLQIYKSII